MPPTWKEIESDPDYKGMAPAEQTKLKRAFLSKVVAKDPDYRGMAREEKQKFIGDFLGLQPKKPPTPKTSNAGEAFIKSAGNEFFNKGITAQARKYVARKTGIGYAGDVPGLDVKAEGAGAKAAAFAGELVGGAVDPASLSIDLATLGGGKALQAAKLGTKLSRPARVAATKALRTGVPQAIVSGATQGGGLAALQGANEGKIDPRKVALQTGVGAVFAGGLSGGVAVAPKIIKKIGQKIGEMKPPSPVARLANESGAVQLGRQAPDLDTPEGMIESRLSIGESKPGLAKLKQGFKESYSNLVDDLDNLNKAEKDMGGDGTVYQKARLTRGMGGKVGQVIEGGAIDYATGKPVSRGLKQILDDVGNMGPGSLDKFRAYATARRGLELHARKIKTGLDRDAIKETIRNGHPRFAQAFDELQQFQDGVLKYAVDAGNLSPEAYAAIKKHNKHYIPMARDVEDGLQTGFAGGGKKLANVATGVKKIKGSERAIIDPFESIIKNTHDVMAAADKNAVGQALVELAKNSPTGASFIRKAKLNFNPTNVSGAEAKKAMEELGYQVPDGVANEMFTIFRPDKRNLPDGVIRVNIKGKAHHFEIDDDDLYKTMMGLSREQIPFYVKMFGAPASLLRAGATLSPEFAGANPIRDTFTAGLQSKYGFVPVYDTIKGLFHAVGKTDLYKQWRLSGGDNALMTTIDRGNVQKELNQIIASKGEKALNLMNPVNALRKLSEYSEQGTRIGEYGRALAGGLKSELTATLGRKPTLPELKQALQSPSKTAMEKAGMASRDSTVDFARMGNQMQNLNKMTAFLNARVQGWDRLRQNLSDPKTAPQAWAKGVAGVAVPSIALLANNMRDERWKSVPNWEKEVFWHVLIPGKPVIRIPKPPGYGLVFATPFERVTEYIVNKDPSQLARIGKALGQEIPNLIPTALTPAIEAKTDYSMFQGKQITPQNKEKLEPYLRFNDRNTEFSKMIGKAVNVSPAIVENTVRGYAGGLGGHAMNIADMGINAMRTANGKTVNPKPATGAEALPFVKAFLSSYERGSDQRVTDFYDAYKNASEKWNTMKELAQTSPGEANTYIQQNQEAIMSYKMLDTTAQQIGKIRNAVEAIKENPALSPQAKKEGIKRLQDAVSKVTTQTMEAASKLKQQAAIK